MTIDGEEISEEAAEYCGSDTGTDQEKGYVRKRRRRQNRQPGLCRKESQHDHKTEGSGQFAQEETLTRESLSQPVEDDGHKEAAGPVA
jgi:hypothetical protein